MAPADSNDAPHPLAKPGYGKQVPFSELDAEQTDFPHLWPRDAAIAAYIDRLPVGADISVKTLAKQLPYGQCALRTSLNRIQLAGHLRRGRTCIRAFDGTHRWVTQTWWTPRPRDESWWTAFHGGTAHLPAPHTAAPAPYAPYETLDAAGPADSPARAPAALAQPPVGVPVPRPTRSRAHTLLAALGRATPALSLSDADCRALAPLAEEWFARGATEDTLLTALTAGLPTPVRHPAALLRTRLTTKLPTPAPPPPAPLVLMECTLCAAPGRPASLPDGFCPSCHPARRAPAPPSPPPVDAHAHAAAIRAAVRK
ncbi:hypothetical protein [Streptomyces sp. NPDC060194]|uniref:hypothetical protein n=1 Tax=Streptomyces sp. NPDC060194 TaxID=3347069 RepID=UPI00364E8E24